MYLVSMTTCGLCNVDSSIGSVDHWLHAMFVYGIVRWNQLFQTCFWYFCRFAFYHLYLCNAFQQICFCACQLSDIEPSHFALAQATIVSVDFVRIKHCPLTLWISLIDLLHSIYFHQDVVVHFSICANAIAFGTTIVIRWYYTMAAWIYSTW